MLNTRERLIEVGAQIFVAKGYANTTTREICKVAQTNITSIHYHFKNKAGLYRAIFSEPFKDFPKPLLIAADLLNKPRLSALQLFYSILLRPFLSKKRHLSSSFLQHKLHYLVHELMSREQFESTGLVDDLIIGPAQFIHLPLIDLLCHYCRISKPDDELHRLAFAIVGLGFSLIHPRHIVKYYAPNLVNQPNWEDLMFTRLASFANSLIEAEIKCRE